MKYMKTLLIALSLGSAGLMSAQVSTDYFEISKNLDIFATMFRELNTYYVDDIEPGKLVRTGIDAMLESLDPYTNFYSEAEAEDYRISVTGQYAGIGAMIGVIDGNITITDPYEGFPAQKADLRAGDILLEVDGKSMKGKSTADVSKLLKGPANTIVKLTIKRDGEGTLVKEITRGEIKSKNVKYYGMINDQIGYISLTGFTNDAGQEVRNAFQELKKNNLKGIVLDLRGNGGGLLHEAVNVVSCFVPRNTLVVEMKGRVSENTRSYRTLNDPIDTEIPLIVLVDRGSASASEIVAGSLQDLDRGVIMGRRSFGKGLVQNTRPLTYNTQLKLTIAKYYTPSGRCIQALDYSNRNPDGSVGAVPDSLRKAFKTRGGRVVYDGGGVSPDILVTQNNLSNISTSLQGKLLIFHFATQYRNAHQEIPEPKSFNLTDQDFDNFRQFLQGKEYDYSTKTEQALAELKKKAEEEKYLAALEQELVALKDKLSHDKEQDLVKNKSEILELLEEEIARRYYFQRARFESSFDDDPDIKAVTELVNNLEKYRQLLSAR